MPKSSMLHTALRAVIEADKSADDAEVNAAVAGWADAIKAAASQPPSMGRIVEMARALAAYGEGVAADLSGAERDLAWAIVNGLLALHPEGEIAKAA